MNTTFLDGVRGRPIAVHRFGGTGEPVLITHAAGLCSGAYEQIAEVLGGEHAVWGIDMIGHGDSPAPGDRDFSWVDMARDVAAVAAQLGDGGPVACVGHSLGGGAALLAEATGPGTFSAIYVYEPAVMPDPLVTNGSEARAMAGLVRRRRRVFASRAQATARLSSRAPFSTLAPAALDAFVRHGMRDLDDGTVELKCTPDIEVAVYESQNKVQIDQIVGVAPPVLVGQGGRDGGVPAVAAVRIAASLPRARLSTFPQLGHFGPLEDPLLVATDAATHFAEHAHV